jgi:hypothetical protein
MEILVHCAYVWVCVHVCSSVDKNLSKKISPVPFSKAQSDSVTAQAGSEENLTQLNQKEKAEFNFPD